MMKTAQLPQQLARRSSTKKFILIAGTMLALALVVFWPTVDEYLNATPAPFIAPTEEDHNIDQNSAKEIHIDGIDNSSQPYTLTASNGTLRAETNTVELTKPHLTLRLKSGAILSLNADSAILDRDKSKIKLIDNVTLTHSTGYTFSTSLAWLDLNNSLAYGHDPVDGYGPQGKVKSFKGFELIDKGEKIKFFGRPQILFENKG